ncbi:hypothetical protein TrLO_g10633 [Triparma laevis f. longispina]|uniref:Uncharacterized protein n=1 Tax=Triparma laevis f. longispina TaxID=1714387 RepID=A0A9W7CJF1_9STRA|nr:hypothetical protein TrLO_g10633 [Triparma laevis f. longispina]
MLMKGSSFIAEGYDSETMGVLLIVSQIIIIVLFLAWAYYKKDAFSTSTERMARDAAMGQKKKKKKSEEDEDDVEVEWVDVGERKGSVFGFKARPGWGL